MNYTMSRRTNIGAHRLNAFGGQPVGAGEDRQPTGAVMVFVNGLVINVAALSCGRVAAGRNSGVVSTSGMVG
jgi:hypothetical protein